MLFNFVNISHILCLSEKKKGLLSRASDVLNNVFASNKSEIAASTAQTVSNKAEAQSEKDLAVAKAETTQASITKTVAEKAENAEGAKGIVVKEGEAAASKKSAIAKMADFVASNKILIITGLIVAAIAAVAAGIYAYIHRLDIKIKKDKKALEVQKEKLEAIEQELKTTNEQIESLNELTEAYKNAVKGSQEYYDIANKIAELQPSLVIGYDENGNAILTNINNINDQIDALKELKREQLEQKRLEAEGVVNASATLIDSTEKKKEKLEEDLTSTSDGLEQAKRELKEIEEELGDQKGGDDRYINARDAVNAYQKTYDDLLEELKNTSQDLRDAKQEWSNNLSYLFDDIPSALSDEEKEYEKAVRQFAIDIAKSNEEAMNATDFLSLYESLNADKNKKTLSNFFQLDTNIPHEEYQKAAQKVYDDLIKSLQDSEFELDDDNELALKIALRIDGESEKNYQNQKKKFAKSVGFKGKNRTIAKDWYDSRTAEELKLIDNNIDKFRSLKYIDAEHLEESLDNVLKKLKESNEEIKELEFSLSNFDEKENDIESLQSLYNQFVENVEDGQVKVPLDISDVEGLREKWEDIVGKEEFDKFELAVTTEGFEDDYQKAFDGMLSKYLSVQISMRGATKETAAMMKSQLKMDGLTEESANNFVDAKMAEAKAYEFTAAAKENNKTLTQENIDAYIAECEQLGIAKDLMGDYLTEAMLADEVGIDPNLEGLEKLAEQLGIDIGLLKELRSLSENGEAFNPDKGEWNGVLSGVSDPRIRKQLLERQKETAKNKNDEAYEKGVFDLDKAKEAAGKTGEEAGDAYVEEFEKALSDLDDLRDSGIINEKDYLNRLQALYIKYFANRKEYIKEFKKYEKQYLEGMQALYEKAISAAITLLNDQKDDLEKAKDDAIDALEDAKDAEIDPINDHIKALEDEKDSLEKEREAMQKANDERERQINLQKAQYELERANSQRTRLIYKNGQMQYVQDYQEVRNAKKNLEDAIFEKNITKLDDQIDNIDNQIENLNKQLDDIEEKYDKLIEDTEKFYDAQIKGVQDLIDMWEKLQHQADLVDAYEALGNFGITANDILSGNLNVFNQIRDGYIGTFAGLSSDANAVAQAFGTTTDNALALKEAILGYDASTASFSELANNIANIGNAATDAAGKVGGSSAEGDANAGGNLNSNLAQLGSKKEDIQDVANAINGDENSLTSAINEFGNTSETVVSKVSSLFGTLAGAIADTSHKLADVINKAKEKLDLATPNKEAKGGAGFSGTAYADGNWTAGSKGIVGKSLVGELGAEIRVRNGKFEVLGSNGAEFADIRKNDIIFNHKQSEELLKNGHINSRGKAFASGNANKFTALSPEELSKYNKLDFTKDLAEKLDFGNQKLMNIDKAVSTITSNKTVNNNPVINVNNPTFTCTGVNSEQVVAEIQAAFTGLFSNAYQRSMTTK